ncbi:MAG TPA: outer membrane protein assembly factor BamD [Myxococcota bacterium]|jgi:outer membrane protein assembly factor BamD|nr:outer membrane protein assembly factor BamD [Myxococcota bacterium]
MDYPTGMPSRPAPRFVAALGSALAVALACAAVAVAVAAAAAAAGCSAETDLLKPVSYEKTAKANYEKGLAALNKGSTTDAQKLFAYVKTKFPYSEFAVFAELRLADTAMARGEQAAAIDAYKLFIKLHPTHVMVPYATFRIGLAMFEQVPSDWFLVPPSYEREQAAVQDALKHLTDYVARYPDHDMVPKAKELIIKCKRKLADHEMYVARFYYKRGKYLATAQRLRGLLADYKGAGLDRDAYYYLVASLASLGRSDPVKAEEACSAWLDMKKDLPDEGATKRALGLLRGAPCPRPAGAAPVAAAATTAAPGTAAPKVPPAGAPSGSPPPAPSEEPTGDPVPPPGAGPH